MLEKEVEQYLCKRVKNDLHGWALKYVSPGQNGVPDRIVLIPMGRIYFVETKAPGKKLRKLQEWVCGLIKDLGFAVLRLDTPSDCLHCVWGKVLDVDGRWIKVYCPRKGCGYIGRGKRNER